MGQSVSSPENSSNDDGNDSSNDDGNEERNNLANLTNIQLKNLLQQPITISAQDILRSARNGAFSSQATESLTSGFYTSENDSELILLAIRINNLSPDLSKLRFKLVPSKIKEPVFWEVVIGLLRERRADELATTGFSGDNDYDVDENTNASTCNGNDDVLSLPRRDSENPSVEEELRRRLRKRDMEVTELFRQLEEARAEIARLQEEEGASQTTNQSTSNNQHKGKWVMDPDSIDFLNYPAELKENLRREKKKRLEEVQSNMKFILESDSPKDSNGKWDCCKTTRHDAEGCAS
jgi:hypothetical protein